MTKNNIKVKYFTQRNLFNPELFLTIDGINKKFGKDTVCFGNQLGNLDDNKLQKDSLAIDSSNLC